MRIKIFSSGHESNIESAFKEWIMKHGHGITLQDRQFSTAYDHCNECLIFSVLVSYIEHESYELAEERQEEPECECGTKISWLVEFFGPDYQTQGGHLGICPDCGKETLHVGDDWQKCVNCNSNSGVDAEGNVYRNGKIVSNGGRSIDDLRGEYFDGHSFLI